MLLKIHDQRNETTTPGMTQGSSINPRNVFRPGTRMSSSRARASPTTNGTRVAPVVKTRVVQIVSTNPLSSTAA